MNMWLMLKYLPLIFMLGETLSESEPEEECGSNHYVSINSPRDTVVVDLLQTSAFSILSSYSSIHFRIEQIRLRPPAGTSRIYNNDLWRMDCDSINPFIDARKDICLEMQTGLVKTTSRFDALEGMEYNALIIGSGDNIRGRPETFWCYVFITVRNPISAGNRTLPSSAVEEPLMTTMHPSSTVDLISFSSFRTTKVDTSRIISETSSSIFSKNMDTTFISISTSFTDLTTSDGYDLSAISTKTTSLLQANTLSTIELSGNVLASGFSVTPTSIKLESLKLAPSTIVSSRRDSYLTLSIAISSSPSKSSSVLSDGILTASPVRCEAEHAAGSKTSKSFHWPATLAGMTSEVSCPEGSEKSAYRSCLRSSPSTSFWGPVNDQECPLPQAQRASQIRLLSDVKLSDSNALEVSKQLAKLTGENPQNMNKTEMKDITNVLDKLARYPKVANEALTAIDNILSANETNLEEAQKEYNTSSTILNMISSFATEVLPLGSNNTFVTLLRTNFDLGVAREKLSDFSGIKMGYSTYSNHGNVMISRGSQSLLDPKDSISIPASITAVAGISDALNSSFVFVFAFHKHGKLFKKNGLNSKPISAKVIGNTLRNLSSPVIIKLTIEKDNAEKNHLCSWWDFLLAAGQGDWSTKGCWLHKQEGDTVTCHCNHLTNFAVLLGARTPTKTALQAHKQALSIISYTGCAISLGGAMATFISYVVFPKLRDRNPPKILMNLCAAYILLLLAYIIGVTRTETKIGCQVTATIIHYFLLTVFTWSAVEGFNSFRGLVKPMAQEIRKFIFKAMAIAWGTPLILVGIGISIWPDSYGDKQSCVVKNLPFYATLLAPIILILSLNLGALIWIMMTLNKSSQTYQHNAITPIERLRIIAAFILLFGLTWVFGFLVVSSDILAFQYIFCILSSLQGFFIFLFYCVRSPNVKTAWSEKLGMRTTRSRSGTTSTSLGESTAATTSTRKTDSIYFNSPIYFNPSAKKEESAGDTSSPTYEEIRTPANSKC